MAIEGLSRDLRAAIVTPPPPSRSSLGIRTFGRLRPRRLRCDVADGVSPKQRRYCCENLPKWVKPKRAAASVTELVLAPLSKSPRTAAKRNRLQNSSGETPMNV